MIFDGAHFIYGDFVSKKYGLIMAHMETSSLLSSAGQVNTQHIYNRADNALYLLRDDLSESPLSFEMEIFRENGAPLSMPDRRIVEKSLFNKPVFRKLYVDTDDEDCAISYQHYDGQVKRFYINCRFMNPSRIEGVSGDTVGYRFTVEADNGFLNQDPITKRFDFNPQLQGLTSYFNIEVDDDTNDYVYPNVTIGVGQSGGEVRITNHTDDGTRYTRFINTPAESTILMKGNTKYVNGNMFNYFSGRNFVRMLDGNNSFSVFGDVSYISFTWNNRRFIW